MLDVRRLRGEGAAGPEKGDVLLVHLFGVDEVVDAVLGDRPAQREAVLIAREIVLLLLQGTFRTQGVGAVEAEGSTLELAGAAAGDDRQGAARRAADLGVIAVVDHPKLAD